MQKGDEKINVQVFTEGSGPITILTGEAPKPLPLHPRKCINYDSTDIAGPAKHWERKKTLYNADHCTVLYDKNSGKIKLIMSEIKTEEFDVVTGTLSENPELKKMNINSESLIGHQAMLRVLRWARPLFPSRDEYQRIVAALTNFKAKVQVAIEKQDDKAGNSIDTVVTTTKHEIPLNFNLKTNLFIDQPEVQFDVTILVQVSGKDLVFGLESLTLHEEQEKGRANIIDSVLARITDVVSIATKL